MLEYLDLRTVEHALLPWACGACQRYFGHYCIQRYLRTNAPSRIKLAATNLYLADYQHQRWEGRCLALTLSTPTYTPLLLNNTTPDCTVGLQDSTVQVLTTIDPERLRTLYIVLQVDGSVVIRRRDHHGYHEIYHEQLQAVELAVCCDRLALITTKGEVKVTAVKDYADLYWQDIRADFVPWLR